MHGFKGATGLHFECDEMMSCMLCNALCAEQSKAIKCSLKRYPVRPRSLRAVLSTSRARKILAANPGRLTRLVRTVREDALLWVGAELTLLGV